MSDPVADTLRIIAERSPESQRRIQMTAQILRDLIAADNANGGSGYEIELAFTLVMAELAT